MNNFVMSGGILFKMLVLGIDINDVKTWAFRLQQDKTDLTSETCYVKCVSK
jgi:hypothetical protein